MKMKILIVDDNNDTLEVLSLRVTRLGHESIRAHNSKEAIPYAEAELPDLIFMDMDLPDVDGADSRRGGYRMDVGPVVGESFESGYRGLPTKTGRTSDVKANNRAIHQPIT